MLVSTTIQAIAEAVVASRQALLPHQQAIVGQFLRMPSYTEARDLGAWDSACQDALPFKDHTELDRLLEAVFEFGGYNLYCAFDAAATDRLYAELSSKLHRAGIACPVAERFTGF